MKDTNCLVTGVDSPLGYQMAKGLAKKGATVVLLTDDLQKVKQTRIELIRESKNPNIDLGLCNLSNLDEVRRFAADFCDRYDSLDVLANLEHQTFPWKTVSAQGHELNFAHNVLGPYVLTQALLDLMHDSGSARVINLGSESHRTGTIYFDDPNLSRSFSLSKAKNQVALGQILWTFELAEQLKRSRVTVNSFSTGGAQPKDSKTLPKFLQKAFSQVAKIFSKKTPDVSRHLLNLATKEKYAYVTGQYFDQGKKGKAVPITYDAKFRQRFWNMCEQLSTPALVGV